MEGIGDKLIVKLYREDNKTASGIVVAEAVKKLSNKGKVVSVGKEVKYLKEGDEIIFSPYDYEDINEADNIVVMPEYSVWAKIISPGETWAVIKNTKEKKKGK